MTAKRKFLVRAQKASTAFKHPQKRGASAKQGVTWIRVGVDVDHPRAEIEVRPL